MIWGRAGAKLLAPGRISPFFDRAFLLLLLFPPGLCRFPRFLLSRLLRLTLLALRLRPPFFFRPADCFLSFFFERDEETLHRAERGRERKIKTQYTPHCPFLIRPANCFYYLSFSEETRKPFIAPREGEGEREKEEEREKKKKLKNPPTLRTASEERRRQNLLFLFSACSVISKKNKKSLKARRGRKRR